MFVFRASLCVCVYAWERRHTPPQKKNKTKLNKNPSRVWHHTVRSSNLQTYKSVSAPRTDGKCGKLPTYRISRFDYYMWHWWWDGQLFKLFLNILFAKKSCTSHSSHHTVPFTTNRNHLNEVTASVFVTLEEFLFSDEMKVYRTL